MDIMQQAKDAALDAIDTDFQEVFTRWTKMAPWRSAEKGGPGSGFHGHAGRPGERGGSAPKGTGSAGEPAATRLPAATAPSIDEVKAATESFYDDLHAQNYESNPVIRAWIGGGTEPEHWLNAIQQRAPQYKDNIAKTLSDGIGVSYKDANLFIKEWAHSSNKSFTAQIIQSAAADEFGLPYSKWQQSLYDKAADIWERDWQRNLDYITLFQEVDSDQAKAFMNMAISDLPFQEEAKDKLQALFPDGLEMPESSPAEAARFLSKLDSGVRQLRSEQMDRTKQALRWIYNDTQRDLKEQGISELILYRGFQSEAISMLEPGETVGVYTNALASWSAERETADLFATGLDENEGATFARPVPASRVFSTPRTGFGCLNEWEFVLLGNEDDEAVVVYTINDGKTKTIKSMMEDDMAKRVINLDDGDDNADWIKKVRGGESQKKELAIHDELAAQHGKPTTEEEGWPDIEPATDESTDEDA